MGAFGATAHESTELNTSSENDAVLLAGVAAEARVRFGRQADRDALVAAAVNIARELLAERPATLEYITEIAIGRSWSNRPVA